MIRRLSLSRGNRGNRSLNVSPVGSRVGNWRGVAVGCLGLFLIAALSFASRPVHGQGLRPEVAKAPALVFPATSGAGNGNGNSTGIGSATGFASGYILVGQAAGSSDSDFQAALAREGGLSLGKLGKLDVHIVNVPSGKEVETVGKMLGHSQVKFAEVDQLMTPAGTANDPYFTSEWHLAKINAPTAWDSSTGAGVTIAILDTGVDGTHPDLAPKMVPGWNFYDNNSNTSDVNGHGTAVAGAAAAATNNGAGVASVAGGAHIMPVRIADPSAYASWSTVAQGINWAADHGAKVVNLSYIGASASATIQSAASYLRSKGGVLFVAAGNSGAIDNTAATSLITVVSATQETDLLASFSTYGSFVDISAPGNNILTTTMGGGYQYWWGTSLATPVAAATAALVISRRPDFTPAQIDSTLKSSATDLGPSGTDIYFGAGRVNAAAAVQLAGGSGPPADTTPPTVSIASPTSGTVSGTVSIAVNASDNVGVTRVDLRVNGAVVANDASPPYQFAWDSKSVADGSVSISAVAYDAANNSAVSSTVTLNVSNATAPDTTPPTVSITSPTGGSTVSGSVTISVTASDNVGVTRVDARVNGVTIGTSNAPPYQFGWNSTSVANGTASLSAVAYDAAGNIGASSAVTVSVYNASNGGAGSVDTTPPTLTITNPANGATVNGNVSIKTSASDDSGPAGITQILYIDGVPRASAVGASLSYSWSARRAASGVHTILVTATDASGNRTTKQVQVTRK